MRAVLRVASVVLCCGLLVPAIANAKVKPTPTVIALVGADLESIRAELRTPFKKCLRQRTVTLTDRGTGAVFHTTTTTRDGRFSIGLADIPDGISALRIKVARKRAGNRLCQRDTADVAFDEATLTGGPNNGAFRGDLSSSVDACEPNRTILLYEVSVPEEPNFVGSNFTDASGAWTIQQAAGTYQARAERAFVGAGDTFTYCRPVFSPTWTFEEPPPEG
jgi:hypothetical protein